MYMVKADSLIIYDPKVEELVLQDPELNLELNKLGEFSFGILPLHPYFDFIQKMKTIITVYDDDQIVFRGRILNDESGFYNEKYMICEGEMGFLNDTIQRPYEFTGTPAELFTQFITNHNAQADAVHQFKIGNITVTDPNDYIARSDSGYTNTWESINNKLIDTHGGYLWVRHEVDGNYIDYLEDFNLINPQPIEFGKNLMDFRREMRGEDIATAIIPIGAEDEETGNPITIESVNNNVDYVYNQEAVDLYGWIFKVVEWDDVTLPENLKTKAISYLTSAVNLQGSIELEAVDLPYNTSFNLGSYINVRTSPHGITNENFLISKLKISLSNPTKNKLTIGRLFSTFADESVGSDKRQGQIIEVVEKVENNTKGYVNDSIDALSKELTSSINQSSKNITTEVGEKYYLKDDANKLISDMNTKFTQTSKDFDFSFTELTKNMNDVQSGNDDEFETIRKYIRFENGDIVIGESTNPVIMRLENNQLGFYVSGTKVSYWLVDETGDTPPKFYVTDAEFLNSLRVGSFEWTPRTNGNLSFGKVN